MHTITEIKRLMKDEGLSYDAASRRARSPKRVDGVQLTARKPSVSTAISRLMKDGVPHAEAMRRVALSLRYPQAVSLTDAADGMSFEPAQVTKEIAKTMKVTTAQAQTRTADVIGHANRILKKEKNITRAVALARAIGIVL